MKKRIGPNPKPLTRAEALGAELALDIPRNATMQDVVNVRDGKPIFERELHIGASMPVALIRQAFETGGQAKAITVGRECFIEGTITDAQILAIAQREATLRGFSHSGITFHDQRCVACRGRGTDPLRYDMRADQYIG